MAHHRVLAVAALASLAALSSGGRAQADIIASSGFNDQSGINSDPTPNSPFQIGVTVNNQGVGEPGWDGPWERHGGFDDRAPISTEYVYEGDASVKLFADNVFGTAIERPWTNIVPQVRIDARVLVRPAAEMQGNAVRTGSVTVASWYIASNGSVEVYDMTSQQFINTGFSTLPNVWNKYSLLVDAQSQTWQFMFNDQLFNSPHTLTFLNPSLYVDRVNLGAAGTLNSYVDAVQISTLPVPEPGTAALTGLALSLGLARRPRRRREARNSAKGR